MTTDFELQKIILENANSALFIEHILLALVNTKIQYNIQEYLKANASGTKNIQNEQQFITDTGFLNNSSISCNIQYI